MTLSKMLGHFHVCLFFSSSLVGPIPLSIILDHYNILLPPLLSLGPAYLKKMSLNQCWYLCWKPTQTLVIMINLYIFKITIDVNMSVSRLVFSISILS